MLGYLGSSLPPTLLPRKQPFYTDGPPRGPTLPHPRSAQPRCPATLPRPLPLARLALSSAFLARGVAESAPSAPAAFFLRRLPRSQLKARRRPERDFFLRGGPPGLPGSSAAGAAGGARAAMARGWGRAVPAAGVRPPAARRPCAGAAAAGDAPGEKFGRRRPNERCGGGGSAGGAAGRAGRERWERPSGEGGGGGSAVANRPSPPAEPRGRGRAKEEGVSPAAKVCPRRTPRELGIPRAGRGCREGLG